MTPVDGFVDGDTQREEINASVDCWRSPRSAEIWTGSPSTHDGRRRVHVGVHAGDGHLDVSV
jgi:hypothetical protein